MEKVKNFFAFFVISIDFPFSPLLIFFFPPPPRDPAKPGHRGGSGGGRNGAEGVKRPKTYLQETKNRSLRFDTCERFSLSLGAIRGF